MLSICRVKPQHGHFVASSVVWVGGWVLLAVCWTISAAALPSGPTGRSFPAAWRWCGSTPATCSESSKSTQLACRVRRCRPRCSCCSWFPARPAGRRWRAWKVWGRVWNPAWSGWPQTVTLSFLEGSYINYVILLSELAFQSQLFTEPAMLICSPGNASSLSRERIIHCAVTDELFIVVAWSRLELCASLAESRIAAAWLNNWI